MPKQIEPTPVATVHDDTYWKKLVDRVREGLRPEFVAVKEHTATEVLKVRRQVKRRLDKTDRTLEALQSSVEALHSSLGDLKKTQRQ